MIREFSTTVALRNGPAQQGVLRLGGDAAVSGPLASCLMVSRGDRFPAALAIECYRRQSYANRELVVVTSRPGSAVGRLVAELGDATIRYVEVDDRTLGELRNAAVAHARGALLCHWDDDDLSHPDRLSVQIAALGMAEAQACFLSRVLLWWPARRLLRLGPVRNWEGSMVADRRAVPVYPALSREEDLHVAQAVTRQHRVVAVDLPAGYCYAVHGGNTNSTQHFEDIVARSTPLPGAEDYDAAVSQVAPHFPLREYEAELVSRSG